VAVLNYNSAELQMKPWKEKLRAEKLRAEVL